MPRTAFVVVFLTALAVVGRAAQSPPDLSGTWRPVNVTAAPAGTPYEITIAQTPTGVTLQMPGQAPDRLTLTFDGQESRTTTSGRGGPTTAASRAVWEGSRLAVSTTLTSGRGPTTVTQKYGLEGDRLTLEFSGTGADGSPGPVRTVEYARANLGPLPAPPARQLEAGYTSLFNGRDLSGWRTAGPADAFTVDRGAIVARATRGASYLFYDGPVGNHAFRNYSLRLDVAARYRSNGGIWILTEFQEQGHPAKGFEVQINNSHTDRIRSGSLYHVVDLSHIPAADDEWYPMEIVVQGETIRISVKGEEVVRWVQPKDWAGSWDFSERRIAPGTIAFQAHDPNSVTAHANIRIRLLD